VTAVKCRPITLDDSADILDWRNDLDTRKMSLNPNFISHDEHSEWFAKMLADCSHIGWIGECNGEKIGVVFVRIEFKIAKVSINLNPEYRGRRFSATLLNRAIEKTLKLFPEIVYFIAEIKNSNISSIKIFSKNRFRIGSNKGDFFLYIRQTGQCI